MWVTVVENATQIPHRTADETVGPVEDEWVAMTDSGIARVGIAVNDGGWQTTLVEFCKPRWNLGRDLAKNRDVGGLASNRATFGCHRWQEASGPLGQ